MHLKTGAGLVLLAVLGCTACGHSHAGLSQLAGASNQSEPQRITADWLRDQPGPRIHGIGLHLLDASNIPCGNWPGLQVSTTSGQDRNAGDTPGGQPVELLIETTGNAPAEIFLYLDYDPAVLALDTVELAPGRAASYLLLTIAHHEPGVLIIAIAQLKAQRAEASNSAGPLASVRFQPGPERVYRKASIVNTDPASAPLLETAAAPGGGRLLRWRERNPGDYDNNSLVGAPDITPIAMHYLAHPAEAAAPAELALIDGDANGEINSADLVLIARNYGASVDGYVIYQAPGSAPGLDEFTMLGNAPAIFRATVWAGADAAARRQALVYEFTPSITTGAYTYYVAAWAADGSLGLASNQVTLTALPMNLPPVWDTTLELTSLAPSATGLRLTFGAATDPEGADVSYYLRYVAGSAADLSGTGAQALVLTTAEIGSTPPFTYMLPLTQRSQSYTLTLQAQDPHGARTAITQYSNAFLPGLAASAEPWGYLHADAARTSANPACGLCEPLILSWQQTPSGFSGPSAPVISQQGWTALGTYNQIARYTLAGGLEAGALASNGSAAPYSLALDGARLVSCSSSGAELWWTGIFPGQVQLTDATNQAAPLLLGEYIILAGADRTICAFTTENYAFALPAWETQLGDQSTDGACLAPASDGTSIYAGLTGGKLYKLNALSGAVMKAVDTGVPLASDSLALDVSNTRLYLASEADLLLELDAHDLSTLRQWPLAAGETAMAAPALALHTAPRLAVCSLMRGPDPGSQPILVAIDLDHWTEAWRYTSSTQTVAPQFSLGASRIYLDAGTEVQVLDYAGRLRQTLPGLPGPSQSSPALAADLMVNVNGGTVRGYANTADLPPTWQGAEGIRALTVTGAGLEVAWDYAVEAQGEPVSYAIYYSTGTPPSFDPPYTGTTIVTGLPHTGAQHHQTIVGLDPGQRYYVGVRAYDGYWDDNPTLDGNTNWLAATPPWQREELRLGTGSELPSGEIYFLRGLADPQGALHLFYSQRADAALTHVWGTTGAWNSEGANLAGYTASTFDLGWDDGLICAWGNMSQFGLLKRIGADTWEDNTSVFTPIVPPVNPQVALALGPDPALVFTNYVDGVFPEVDLDYYAQQYLDDAWQAASVLDDQNYAGRDIDLALNPSDLTLLWAAYQRGGNNTPERATPMTGSCCFARGDGLGGFAQDVVDSGANAPVSDCGKRVQQALDSSGRPWLAYFDLNCSASQPMGELKCAHWSGSAWLIESVANFDLSFQTGSNQFTYGELGFALDDAGRAIISILARQSWSTQVNLPHWVRCYAWVRELNGSWHAEQLTDNEHAFPRDREPCVLLITPDGGWHIFFASSQHPADATPVADKLVHLWRPAPAV